MMHCCLMINSKFIIDNCHRPILPAHHGARQQRHAGPWWPIRQCGSLINTLIVIEELVFVSSSSCDGGSGSGGGDHCILLHVTASYIIKRASRKRDRPSRPPLRWHQFECRYLYHCISIMEYH